MPDLQGTSDPQRKEQVGAADWRFVVWVIIIAAIAVTLTLTQIYLQNPR
jgi:hypothetical protein